MTSKISFPDCSANLDDEGKVTAFDDRINTILTSTFTGLGIIVGTKLKLIEILSTGEFTREELGQKAKVKEHYLKEWLSLMVSGGIIDAINNEVPEKYTLPEYRKKTLVNGFGTQFLLMTPEYSKLIPKLIQCMKINGPDGYEFDPHTARMKANAESEGEGEGEGHSHGHGHGHGSKSKHGHGHKHIHPKIPEWSNIKKTYESVPNLVERLEKGINALDLGCGNGHLFITLAKQFPNSTFKGADPFKEAIDDANKEVKELGLKNVSFSVSDVLALPDEWTGKYDYVHASRMLHHVKKPTAALKQFVKVLKPDGTFSLFEGGADGLDGDFVGDVAAIFSKFNDLFCFGPTAEFNKEQTVGLGLKKTDAVKLLEGVGFKVLVPEYQPSNQETHNEESGLGDEPVQHREVQGYETDEFLALFKGGLQYLPGGVATGFKHVDREAFETRLLHIKGRRNIRVAQVKLEASSLNEGDVFILDAGRNIFQWNGKEASRVEKTKALEVTKRLRDEERGGNSQIHIIDQGVDDDSKFWEAFGVSKPGKIKSASEGGDDAKHSRAAAADITLYRVSNASGSMQVTEVEEKPYKQSSLDTNDAFILDCGPAGIFVWVGKGADKEERAFSMKTGMDFLKQKGYPNHTPVTRVVEMGETPLFKQNFPGWKDPNALLPGQVPAGQKKKFIKKSFSASALHSPAEREKASLPDDGKGKLEVWRVENFELVEVPKEAYGHFYGGDSYVMLYTYIKNTKEEYIIYFWQGLKSSQDERGASAKHAVDLDDRYGGAPVQVRVVQNKEPSHFYLVMQQFGGMVVHEGGHASGWKNVNDTDSYDTDGTRLFQVRGTNDWNTRAIQVDEEPKSLNSGDVFVLETPSNVFLWFGKGCTGDEREFSKKIVKTIVPKRGANFEVVTEGAEPAEFWTGLGWDIANGRPTYAELKAESEQEYHEPRLFQCSNNRGYFYVEEIYDYDQEDLIEEDVMLLDTYFEIFVWVGKGANATEKKGALEAAFEYVKTDPSGRTVDDTCIMQVKQGFEPTNFRCHFHAWDDDKWSDGLSYEELKKKLGSAADAVDASAALDEWSGNKKYPYELLRDGPLPESVDVTAKEQYLSDEEFQSVFGMDRGAFNALPKWKQNGKKKEAKLF